MEYMEHCPVCGSSPPTAACYQRIREEHLTVWMKAKAERPPTKPTMPRTIAEQISDLCKAALLDEVPASEILAGLESNATRLNLARQRAVSLLLDS